MFKLVEKDNHLAVHGLFDTAARAERHLADVVPGYVDRGLFMDKTLTANSFEIIEVPKCCVCGTEQNLHKDGRYGYRCASAKCACF